MTEMEGQRNLNQYHHLSDNTMNIFACINKNRKKQSNAVMCCYLFILNIIWNANDYISQRNCELKMQVL